MKKLGLISVFYIILIILTACGSTQQSQTPSNVMPATIPSPSASPSPSKSPTQVKPPPCTDIGQTWVSPVDGMLMVCVPSGSFYMGAGNPSAANDRSPQHWVTLDAYWIDSSEVTNAQFDRFVKTTDYLTDAEKAGVGFVFDGKNAFNKTAGAFWRQPKGPGSSVSNRANYPVVQISWNDASAYCQWSERRLPTEAEWEKAARGTDGRPYPWGTASASENLVNFNRNIMDVTPVGKYKSGVSPFGAFDMAGNVWEWVSDWYGIYPSSSVVNPTGPSTGQYRVMRGGSWFDGADGIGTTVRNRYGLIDGGYESNGFRCASSSASTTTPVMQTPVLTPSPILFGGLPPCTTIGQTWLSPVDGMPMMCVPAGQFVMGASTEDKLAAPNERPQHTISLDAFWMAKTEVTNKMFKNCVKAGGCFQPKKISSSTRQNYYQDPSFDDYPVINISRYDAISYCSWAGLRLPTEAEWEKAARGSTNQLYPWGSIEPNRKFLNFNKDLGDTTQVGSYTSGASIYGLMDLSGNVWEWVSDFFQENYYQFSPTSNPKGAKISDLFGYRGGSWASDAASVRVTKRGGNAPDFTSPEGGFRCVR